MSIDTGLSPFVFRMELSDGDDYAFYSFYDFQHLLTDDDPYKCVDVFTKCIQSSKCEMYIGECIVYDLFGENSYTDRKMWDALSKKGESLGLKWLVI